ncbi:MAG: ABC transporter permease [Bryobacterales bacterium]|nr:ABC transporter permease [Bryobacterales bacterium]
MQNAIRDLRYALRALRKAPGFTAVAVLTLGLGIGANTSIFSVVNSVLLKALPYPESDRLVSIWETLPSGDRNGVSAAVFLDWRDHARRMAHVALYKEVRLNMTGAGRPEHLTGLQVSSAYLSVLGSGLWLGRGFTADEDAPGGDNRVAVLAYRYWQQRFGADPQTVGRTVLLNQVPHTIVGILPPGALLNEEHQFLIPFKIGADSDTVRWIRGYHCCGVIGRLRAGVTAADAQAELRGIRQQLAAQYPAYKKDWSLSVTPLHLDLTRDVKPTLLLLLGTAGLVLLIACVNVANLLLARGQARMPELAVRKALGASAGQIARQLLTEGMLLAGGGCLLGLLLALFGTGWLGILLTGVVPQALHPEVDTSVLVFSILVSGLSGLGFGLIPAWRAGGVDAAMREAGVRGGSHSLAQGRSQQWLVAAEFAFTLILLVGAGLLLRSFVRLLETDPGFNPQKALAFDLSFARDKYPKGADQQRLLAELLAKVQALPGVQSAGASTHLPLGRGDNGDGIRRDAPPENNNGMTVGNVFVTGRYFEAMGIQVRQGRPISDADNRPDAPPVLVIDATVARTLFPQHDAVGQRLRFLNRSWEVVGIVAPVRHNSLQAEPRPRVYGARGQASYPTSSVVIRSAAAPAGLAEAVRRTIAQVDPDQPIANVRTLEEAVRLASSRQRTTLALVGLFAALAIGLACVGIYGVVSFAAGLRVRELGIRAALGATPGSIVRLVLAGGMRWSLIGTAAGLAGAYVIARMIESLLFEVDAHDPLVFAASVCLLLLVAALSSYLPARRAAKVDPVTALRAGA